MKAIGRWSVGSFIWAILAFIKVGLAAALLAALCVMMAVAVKRDPTMTVIVPVSFSMDAPASVRLGRSGFGFEILNPRQDARRVSRGRIDSVDGSLRVPTSSRVFIVANALIVIVILAFALYVVNQLGGVLRTVSAGQPFVPGNALRIRRVALAVIAGELASSAIVFAENYYAMTYVTIPGLQFDAWPRVDLVAIGYGLIIFVIAEVFRAGTRLDEEQSLTI